MTASSQNFNKMTHKPPRIDGFFFNEDPMSYKVLVRRNQSNILQDKTVKIPDWWKEKHQRTGKMTQRILLEERKKEGIPDISYDLDGDGFVG